MSQSKQWVVLDSEAAQYIDIITKLPESGDLCVNIIEFGVADGSPKNLQQDLDTLGNYETCWQLSFNPSKCHALHITRCRTTKTTADSIRGDILEPVSEATYLGLKLTNNLITWSIHISLVTL